jgi:hypothetical protein
MCVCVCVCVCVCMYVCVYIHVYICICVCVYIYIYLGHVPGVTSPEATYEKLMKKLCEAALSANPASYSAQSVANMANALVFIFYFLFFLTSYSAHSVANMANALVFIF